MSSPLSLPLIRSTHRKTLAIVANRRGELSIRAPKRLPLSVIEQFVRNQQDWITRHTRQHPPLSSPTYEHDSTVLLHGKEVPVLHTSSATTSLSFHDGAFHLVARNHYRAKPLFLAWYKKEATHTLNERVAVFAKRMQATPKNITISSAHSLWGSCRHDNALRFSWRLLMAPPDTRDYVVIHELAHITHKHHGPQFWKHVAQFCPEYKTHRAWLGAHGRHLVL